jgi:histidinol-phosphatase (PHP family)
MARIPHDYHVHSLFSGDNDSPMQSMCEAAAARGIPEICFAEHFDVHPKEPRRLSFPLEAWAAELVRCRDIFRGRLVVRAGLEVGEPHRAPAAVRAMLDRYDFDLVIGSLHWVGDDLVFDAGFFDRPMDAGYSAYFAELERMTEAGGFDVLGHLDVVARFGFEVWGRYEPRRYETSIRKSLAHCIERGIALDINAGCMRRRLGRTNPHPDILRWYVEMGGAHVVFSSDAHAPEHVGLHLDAAVAIARTAGLANYVAYAGRVGKLCALDFESPRLSTKAT